MSSLYTISSLKQLWNTCLAVLCTSTSRLVEVVNASFTSSVTTLEGSFHTTCAHTADGDIYCWGKAGLAQCWEERLQRVTWEVLLLAACRSNDGSA